MNKLKHLREERARIEGEMSSILATCETEKRSPKAEEMTKWNTLKSERDALLPQIEMQEEQEKIDARSAKPVGASPVKPAVAVDDEQVPSLRAQLRKWAEDNKDVIEASRRNAVPLPPIQLRAVATMTHAKVNAGNSVYLPNSGAIQGGVIDLNRTQPTFWTRLQKGSTKQNPYVWVNKVNKEGTAQFIAEGALKPLASFELETETSVPKKVAEAMKVSREVLYDIEGMASMIEDELLFEVDVASNTATLTGTVSSTSPAGITTLATAYTLTGVETVTPNNADAVRAGIAQLTTLNFNRDIVAFMDPVDAANMDLAKGEDGHYVLPPFTTLGGQTVKGVTIIEDNNIAQGYLLIGDMSKYRILMYQEFFVEWGWENDDFRKNLITVIGERRFHQFMSGNHEGAFIYDTFANIKTAITA